MSASALLAEEAALPADKLKSNFLWFALSFAVNHGVVTTPLVLSTSVLGGDAGYIGNAVLNIFTMIGSFFLGAPITAAFGPLGGVLFGMFNYCLYAGLFTVAAYIGRDGTKEITDQEVLSQVILFSLGSALGGIAAGVLWTAQGAYFNKTVDLLYAQAERGDRRETITSHLAGRFATLYLACEVLAKLLWSLLEHFEVTGWVIALTFTAIGAVALLFQTTSLKLRGPLVTVDCCQKAKVAAALWLDPVLWLISGINLTFGFSAAFMNGYVNKTYTGAQLGNSAVTGLAALTALSAGVLSQVFGAISTKSGKGPIVILGSLSFLGIPFCFFALKCCENWNWWLIVLYLLQGSGRAVYESTNKGIFADLFKTNAPGAFANQILQVTGAFAACFFLSSILKGETLAWIALVLSLVTPFGYLAAVALRKAQAAREERCRSSQAALSETPRRNGAV
mmetsp:Transcript_58422/g.123927  ORF Transcript_58422/g.123927 Transcript_58422/m.123927 type:complete len:451 (+) Transcript_58422:110-1462(+)